MDWLRENWFWLTVFGLFAWMHMGMHGGGGHGRKHLSHGHEGPDVDDHGGGPGPHDEQGTIQSHPTDAPGADHAQ